MSGKRVNTGKAETARQMFVAGVGIADIAKQLSITWTVARSYADPNGTWRTFPTEKVCKACGETVPIEDYPTDNVQPDRHGYRCKPCSYKAQKRCRDGYTSRVAAIPEPDIKYRCPVCEMGRRMNRQWFTSQDEADKCCVCPECGLLYNECECHEMQFANREQHGQASPWKYKVPWGKVTIEGGSKEVYIAPVGNGFGNKRMVFGKALYGGGV